MYTALFIKGIPLLFWGAGGGGRPAAVRRLALPAVRGPGVVGPIDVGALGEPRIAARGAGDTVVGAVGWRVGAGRPHVTPLLSTECYVLPARLPVANAKAAAYNIAIG